MSSLEVFGELFPTSRGIIEKFNSVLQPPPFIMTPYHKEPVLLVGYYMNKEADGTFKPYFFGADKVGYSFERHYDLLRVIDYQGVFRPLVLKNNPNDNNSFSLAVNLDKSMKMPKIDSRYSLRAFYTANIPIEHVVPGDFELCDNGNTRIILHITVNPDDQDSLDRTAYIYDPVTQQFETKNLQELTKVITYIPQIRIPSQDTILPLSGKVGKNMS